MVIVRALGYKDAMTARHDCNRVPSWAGVGPLAASQAARISKLFKMLFGLLCCSALLTACGSYAPVVDSKEDLKRLAPSVRVIRCRGLSSVPTALLTPSTAFHLLRGLVQGLQAEEISQGPIWTELIGASSRTLYSPSYSVDGDPRIRDHSGFLTVFVSVG
jgi:hypothetical protein